MTKRMCECVILWFTSDLLFFGIFYLIATLDIGVGTVNVTLTMIFIILFLEMDYDFEI